MVSPHRPVSHHQSLPPSSPITCHPKFSLPANGLDTDWSAVRPLVRRLCSDSAVPGQRVCPLSKDGRDVPGLPHTRFWLVIHLTGFLPASVCVCCSHFALYFRTFAARVVVQRKSNWAGIEAPSHLLKGASYMSFQGQDDSDTASPLHFGKRERDARASD
ncbi:hypothetical protein B0T10DRAFT_461676 [Thelonectria olida]|uniref:Uncharacterized protein n=1 Tax=Thelonectria olida TaxID=1576542 RepID=A0A9P8W2W3_9HYPO|nr:hypothetical protein B0T10DRAFT_461676 [Thelonectria olida]